MLKSAGVIASLVVVAVQGGALDAEMLYCATSFQGYKMCSGPDGHVAAEWTWQDRTVGSDNRGNRWTTWRFHDTDIITVTPPDR